jgi:predicted transcriptional regulator of viral defense system
MFSDLELDDAKIFHIANQIYEPSYISFELVLSRYAIIPEAIAVISSATTRKTATFKSTFARFIYHSINKKYFWGYEVIKVGNTSYKIAKPEKALLDYFYINTKILCKEDFEYHRIDASRLKELIDFDLLDSYLEKFHHHRLKLVIKNLKEYVNNV